MRTAVIGAGNMGKHHARIYSKLSKLVAISDQNSQAGYSVAKKYGAFFYEDYKKMLNKEKIDAVSVVVPTPLHKEITCYCLEKKIPTLTEKPIADSIDDAHMMMESSKKNNTFLMIGHVERFNPAVIKLKEYIEQGKMGKIISLLAIRVGMNPPKSIKSDVALDLAIHDIDIFNFILGEYPRKKIVWKSRLIKNNVSDTASIMLHYKNSTGIIQTNWITPIKMRKLYITGSRAFAEMDYINQKLIFYKKILNRKNYEEYIDLVTLAVLPQKEIYFSKQEPLKKELKFFLNISRTNPNYQSLEYAIEAIKVVY